MDCLAALCQMRPALGDLERNFAAHHAWLDRCEEAGAELLVFPELSLTGYFLKDLTHDVALRLDDPRVKDLVARTAGRSVVFGMVEESEDHRFFNSAVFAEDGRVLHVHRKCYLPTYGIFEEGRFLAAGDEFQVVKSRLGRIGLLVCEDAWHVVGGWLQFLRGAELLIVPSASPARGVDTEEPELSSMRAWRTLNAAQALYFQSWLLFCNRVGFEDGANFWGGSAVYSPFGYPVAEAPGEDEHLLLHRLESDPVRRARIFTPLRRDARPELVRLELARILRDPDALGAATEEP